MRVVAAALLLCGGASGLTAGGRLSSYPRLRGRALACAPPPPQPDVSRYYAKPRDAATAGYIMQQTMVRVKEPKASLDFYCDVLGFNLIMMRSFPQWSFNVYFVAQTDPTKIPTDEDARWAYCMRTPGCIELTWNYGSEAEEGRVYNTGNSDSTGSADGAKVRGGFGHLGITVPDVYEACERYAPPGPRARMPLQMSPAGRGLLPARHMPTREQPCIQVRQARLRLRQDAERRRDEGPRLREGPRRLPDRGAPAGADDHQAHRLRRRRARRRRRVQGQRQVIVAWLPSAINITSY